MCSPVGVLRHVYSALLTSRFCATGEIDRVSEKAISRHPLADHPRHHFSSVDPDGDLGRPNDRKKATLTTAITIPPVGGSFVVSSNPKQASHVNQGENMCRESERRKKK